MQGRTRMSAPRWKSSVQMLQEGVSGSSGGEVVVGGDVGVVGATLVLAFSFEAELGGVSLVVEEMAWLPVGGAG